MAISTIDEKLKDVIQVKLGNIEPKENIKIKLSYLEAIESNKGAMQFRIPIVTSPRYNNTGNLNETNYLSNQKYSQESPYTWNISGKIQVYKDNLIQNFDILSHTRKQIKELNFENKKINTRLMN